MSDKCSIPRLNTVYDLKLYKECGCDYVEYQKRLLENIQCYTHFNQNQRKSCTEDTSVCVKDQDEQQDNEP